MNRKSLLILLNAAAFTLVLIPSAHAQPDSLWYHTYRAVVMMFVTR